MDTYTQNPYSAPPSAPTPKKSNNKIITTMITLLLIISIANTAFISLLFFTKSSGTTSESQLNEKKEYNSYAKDVADDSLTIKLSNTSTDAESATFTCSVTNTASYDVSDVVIFYHFYDSFHGSKSLFIDFTTSGGINFFGIMAYYILSPFSFILLLFMDVNNYFIFKFIFN